MDKRKGCVLPEIAIYSVRRPCEQEIRRYERPETAGTRFDGRVSAE